MKKCTLNFVALFFLLAGLLVGAGCVSKELEPEHKPKLGVVQNPDNSITMMLDTEIGYRYTILYLHPQDKTWKLVKGCESIDGTGETINIRKQFSSQDVIPPFTVDYVKIK